jgi:hypothetical protein
MIQYEQGRKQRESRAMLTEQLLDDVLRDLHQGKKTGALYIDVVEQSEDMLRIYFENGEIYFIRYGSAAGNDVLDIIEYYNLYSATFFEGVTAPGKPVRNLPPTPAIIARIGPLKKKIRLR